MSTTHRHRIADADPPPRDAAPSVAGRAKPCRAAKMSAAEGILIGMIDQTPARFPPISGSPTSRVT